MHRQRVEKFVGDDQERTIVRQRLDRIVPDRASGRLSACFSRSSGLVSMKWIGGSSPATLHRAQHIDRERAAPRPQLHQHGIVGPSGALPHVGQREPHDLAEHLADLGRGDEVAHAPVDRGKDDRRAWDASGTAPCNATPASGRTT